jgi:LuxR family maltose regulon positive regulatory protein
MQTLVSSVKSYIPQTKSGYIKRNDLIDKINSGLNKKLTIVSAPAGFGKTSLLSNWIEQSSLDIAWLSTDKSDNNISFFFTYLINSIEKINKSFGISLKSLLNSSTNFSPDFFANMFDDELKKHFTKCIVVLDDFHLIENKDILDFISSLINKSTNLHLIIISRTQPNIKISKLRLDNDINELNSNDLRFNKEEQRQFFNDNCSIKLSEKQLNNIDSKTEGWIAGLQFYVLLMKKSKNTDDLSIDESIIEDYIINEVFENQDKQIQDFLVKSSILKSFNPELLNYMLCTKNSENIIQKLNHDNLFITDLDKNIIDNKDDLQEYKWYRYHNSFRNILNKRLKDFSEVELKELHNRAIEWFENHSLIIEALIYCLENKEYDKYCQLLTKISIKTVMTGELELFKNLCKNIPETIIMKYPIICLSLGWTNCLTHNLELVEKFINYTENGNYFPNKDIHIELLKAYYYTLYFKADDTYFKRCITLILKLKKEVKDDDVLKSAIERILGGLYIVTEEWQLALESFLLAKSLGKSSKNNIVWISSAANYSLLLVFCGEFNKAQKICNETIKDLENEFGTDSPLLSYIYQPLAKTLYENNETEQALIYLEKSINLAHKIDNKFLQITSLLEISVIYANDNNIKKSLEYLNLAENLIVETPIYKDIFIEFNLLKLWIIHKKYDEINIFTERYNSEKLLKKSINEYKELMYAKLLLKENKSKESEELLKELINQKEHYISEHNNRSLNRFFYLETLILLSYVYKKNLNMPMSIETLKKAIIYSIEKNYLKTFINEYKNISDILSLISKENNQNLNNYIFKIIKKDDKKNTLQSLLSEREIEIIKLLEIGFTNQEIAEKLILAIGTVKKHTNTIYQKLNVNNRVSAIQKSKEIGII